MCKGITGHTTAKVSSLHALAYDSLRSTFGAEGARAYAAANQAGLERIAGYVEELGIECDLRRKPNVTYVTSAAGGAEHRARGRGGARMPGSRPSSPTPSICRSRSLPRSAVPDQAEFHPRKYVLGLAG